MIPQVQSVQIEHYLTISRVRQKHALIYLTCMSFIFLVFFLVELIHSRYRTLWKKLFGCCMRKVKWDEESANFSNNIYKELSPYDLRTEYRKTETEFQDLKLMLHKNYLR